MKCDLVAEGFSLKAVECFSSKKYVEALENYNQCLRFSTNKSQVQSAAFAGRAEVFYEVKKYEKCLDNIQSAIDACDDVKNYKRLKTIQEECRENMKNESEKIEGDTWSFFKLTQPAHKKVPFIAECLDVRENEVYGRYIMTNKDLNPGDIVVVEEPFYKVLDPQQRFARCAICLQRKMMNLFPCAKCDAMFCSKKCSDSVVHRYECNTAKEESFEKNLLQRMFYQAIEIIGSLEELQKLMNREMTNKTIMDYDLSDPTDPLNDKNRILATTSLAEREPWSAEAYAKYESVTQLMQTQSEDERDFVRNYLVRCLKSMTVNFFHFFWSPNQLEGQGFALCSLAAYFIHSCDPNVEKIDVDNKLAFVVKKPILAGEQLFMNYDRYSFLTHSLDQRQDYFNKIYTFQCACDACTGDFPPLQQLRKFDVDFELVDIENISAEDAELQYKSNCSYIMTNMVHYPCFEICSLMIQNYQLLHAIGNNLPF